VYLATAAFLPSLVQQIVSGIASGATYASIALALVLIYRAMDIVNFAQGEMAMFTTFIAYTLITSLHLPYAIVFVATVAVALVGGFAVQRIVIRPFERGPHLTVLIVTLALFFIINGLAGLLWGYVTKSQVSPFPGSSINFGGLYLGVSDLGVIGITLALLLVLYLFFRYTKLGLAMRASALYPESCRLLGVRTSQMLALGWGLSAAVGAVSGMLVAPITFLDPNFMQPVLLFAFAGAVVGGIESPAGAVVGSVMVGILLALVGTYIPGGQNLRIAIALIVIVAVLVVKPAGLFGRAVVRRV
jgi:branched-chain amino acid transport system permease protein